MIVEGQDWVVCLFEAVLIYIHQSLLNSELQPYKSNCFFLDFQASKHVDCCKKGSIYRSVSSWQSGVTPFSEHFKDGKKVHERLLSLG